MCTYWQLNITCDSDSDKRQTHTLVREGGSHGLDSNFQTGRNIWSWAPDGARHQDKLTYGQLQCDFHFQFERL
jgi:hypothetical protein